MKKVLLKKSSLKKLFEGKNAQTWGFVIGLVMLVLGVLLAIYFFGGLNANKKMLKPVFKSLAPLLLFVSRERLRRFLC